MLAVHVEGIGWLSPGIADWAAAERHLRDAMLPLTGAVKPAAPALPPGERRRAPESVLLACDVAGQACAMAGRDPAELPCVFASAYGDLAISDAMCATLAAAPCELSPTRFHNSVHNAAAGYWTLATGCHAPSSALSAGTGSFAAGLLEAAAQAHAENTPVLFVAHDIAARGPLAEVIRTTLPFAVALVITCAAGPRTRATLRLRHDPQPAPPLSLPPALSAFAAATPLAPALPLFAALADTQPATLRLSSGTRTSLLVEVRA